MYSISQPTIELRRPVLTVPVESCLLPVEENKKGVPVPVAIERDG